MTLAELDNLAARGLLKREPPDRDEFKGLVRSGLTRLKDASNTSLAFESRFDLAYNAAHALALAALRWHGYRADSRYAVFQALPHTLRVEASVWRVLTTAHDRRNDAEYEGEFDEDPQLLRDLLAATGKVSAAVAALGPVAAEK